MVYTSQSRRFRNSGNTPLMFYHLGETTQLQHPRRRFQLESTGTNVGTQMLLATLKNWWGSALASPCGLQRVAGIAGSPSGCYENLYRLEGKHWILFSGTLHGQSTVCIAAEFQKQIIKADHSQAIFKIPVLGLFAMVNMSSPSQSYVETGLGTLRHSV